MTPAQPAVCQDRPSRAPRSWLTLIALLLGTPLAAGILYAIHEGPWQDPLLKRYTSHPVEAAEVLLFCIALGALFGKFCGSLLERLAARARLLPSWDGRPLPVSEAGPLRAGLNRLGRRVRNSLLGRRVAAVLDFVRSRGSAAELDDQMRSLADSDAIALENSYSLLRFITWAIPILGFLGTVLGITEALVGVTPEVLEKNLSQVTDGLALAFDTTALALGLTMVLMFLTSLTERLEQGALGAVDRYADEQLAHRFERGATQGSAFVEALRQNTQVLLRATEEVVERQASLWAGTVAEAQKHWTETGEFQQEQLMTAMEAALQRTLDSHQERLAELERQSTVQACEMLERLTGLAHSVRETTREQQEAIARLTQQLTAQTEAMTRLQQQGGQLARLQQSLHDNLTALTGAGAFEQAVHSLTAAIHLLTLRVNAPEPAANRPAPRPGAAA
jgi:hypothetical protein